MVFEPNGGPRKPISSSAVASAIGMRHGGQLRPSLSGASPADGDTLSRVICRLAVKRWQSEATMADFLLISLQYDSDQLRRCN